METARRNGLLYVAVAFPFQTLLVWFALWLTFIPGLKRLQIIPDAGNLVPDHSAEIQYDGDIRNAFGIRDKIVVAIESNVDVGIFDRSFLKTILAVTEQIRVLPGMSDRDIVSLATEKSGRYEPGMGFPALLDSQPDHEEDMKILRDDLEALEIYTGTLISVDGSRLGETWSPTSTAILVNIPDGANPFELVSAIENLAEIWREQGFSIHVVGGPVGEALLGKHILSDLLLLIPISAVLLSCFLFLVFRSLRLVAIPLLQVVTCLTVTLGLMGYLGYSIEITTIILPVVIIPIVIADEIHLFFFIAKTKIQPQIQPSQYVKRALREYWKPIVKTSVTTSIGFLGFTLSPIAPVQEFGLSVAVAILLCMAWTLTATPALLITIAPEFSRRGQVRALEGFGQNAGSQDRWTLKHPVLFLMLWGLMMCLVLPLGFSRLRVQDSWQSGFSPKSEFSQSTDVVNQRFYGSEILKVVFDTSPGKIAGSLQGIPSNGNSYGNLFGAPSDFILKLAHDSSRCARYEGLRTVVRSLGRGRVQDNTAGKGASLERVRIGQVVPCPQHCDGTFLTLKCQGNSDGKNRIQPKDRQWTSWASGERILDPQVLGKLKSFEEFLKLELDGKGGLLGAEAQIATTRFMFHGRQPQERRSGLSPLENKDLLHLFAAVRGASRLNETVDGNRDRAVVTLFLSEANYRAVQNLYREIRAYERRELTPHGIAIGFAGDVAVSQALIAAIVKTEFLSLGFSLVMMIIVLSLMERSIILGLACTLPPVCAVLINFAIMGIFGIPIGVATSMFGSITLGIGVDASIHLMARWRNSPKSSPLARWADALGRVGPVFLLETVMLAFGFSVLWLSSVPANGRLGLLLITSVISCSLITFYVLPALFQGWANRGSPKKLKYSP